MYQGDNYHEHLIIILYEHLIITYYVGICSSGSLCVKFINDLTVDLKFQCDKYDQKPYFV